MCRKKLWKLKIPELPGHILGKLYTNGKWWNVNCVANIKLHFFIQLYAYTINKFLKNIQTIVLIMFFLFLLQVSNLYAVISTYLRIYLWHRFLSREYSDCYWKSMYPRVVKLISFHHEVINMIWEMRVMHVLRERFYVKSTLERENVVTFYKKWQMHVIFFFTIRLSVN